MAFFDNLSKKASETTAKAMQKAQEISEITKYNAMISDEEKKVNNAYLQIGRMFISKYGTNCESEFTEMAEIVLEGEQKIKEYKTQIRILKGVQKCEKCGNEIARGVAFCSACGTPVPKIEVLSDAELIACKNCGEMVKKGMKFCTSCGNAIVLDEDDATSAVNFEENSEKIEEKICQSHGAAAESDINFCTECDTKL